MSTTTTETRGFQAEVKQLLKLMIHSLYSHREIFLRELISNASDACDKLRFAALAEPALIAEGGELDIRIDFDSATRTLTVTDSGIGLTREEAVEHLGTIVSSPSSAWSPSRPHLRCRRVLYAWPMIARCCTVCRVVVRMCPMLPTSHQNLFSMYTGGEAIVSSCTIQIVFITFHLVILSLQFHI